LVGLVRASERSEIEKQEDGYGDERKNRSEQQKRRTEKPRDEHYGQYRCQLYQKIYHVLLRRLLIGRVDGCYEFQDQLCAESTEDHQHQKAKFGVHFARSIKHRAPINKWCDKQENTDHARSYGRHDDVG
jgi:hypothetical protein